MNKARKRVYVALGIAAAFAVVLFAAFKIYAGNYYRADVAMLSEIEENEGDAVKMFSDENGMVFLPAETEAKAVIMFYPGGKVECTAYKGFMMELCKRGCICILPEMPENLAFLNTNAAEEIFKGYEENMALAEDMDWYLAGHSLGGVAAATYLDKAMADGSSIYKGLILCASYTTEDFSDEDIRLYSIYGANDGVLNMGRYEDSKERWPKDATECVIDGGIHSYFGCYGIQDGDGVPTITNEEQLEIAADKIVEWIGLAN